MTLDEFIATRRAVDCVETACGFDADMPNQPGFVYADTLYIERHGADGYVLTIGNETCEACGPEGLRALESELYAYACADGWIAAPDTDR